MATANNRYYQYIKPLAQNKFVRSYSPYIFSLIMAAVLVVFAIKPTFSTIVNLQKDIQNHQETLDKLTQKSKDITLAKRSLENMDKTTRAKIIDSVPQTAQVSTVITSLKSSVPTEASAASVIQIQPVTMTPVPPSNHPELESVGFTFNTEGSYENFIKILNNIRVASRAITIEAVSISKQTDTPTVMSITGKGYYLK
jgi:hypothetical protein